MDVDNIDYLDAINKNLLIVGLCSIVNAFGIRFLWDDLNEEHKSWFNSNKIKKAVIFTLLFVTTRNVLITIFLFLLYLNFRKYLKYSNRSTL